MTAARWQGRTLPLPVQTTLRAVLLIAVSLGAGCAGGEPAPPAAREALDHDRDGVVDARDLCPLSRLGLAVDADGCPLDEDNDQVPDSVDRCPQSAPGAWVDGRGCDQDRDRDGVLDLHDRCLETPSGTLVDASGCRR